MLAGENPLDYVERRMRERLAAAVERQQQYASAVVTGNQSNLSWSDVKKMHLEYSPRNGGAITVRNPSPTGGPPLPPPQGMLLDASVASSNSTLVNNNNIARRLELSPYRSTAAVQRPVALPPSTTVGAISSSSFSSSSPTIASRHWNGRMGSSPSANPSTNAAGEVVAVKPCSASMVHDELWDRVHRDEATERSDEGQVASSVGMWGARETPSSPRLPHGGEGAAWSQQQRRAELPTTSLDYNSRPQNNNNNRTTDVKGAWPQRAAPQWSGDGATRSHKNDDSVAPHYGPLRSISSQSVNSEELQRPQQPLQTLSPRSMAQTQPRPPHNVNLPSSSRLSDADNDQGNHKHYDPLSQGSSRNAPPYDGLCESAVPSYTTTTSSGGGGFTIDIPTMPWFRREAPPSNVESYRRQDMVNRALPGGSTRQSPVRQRRNGSAVAAKHADVPSRVATVAVSSSRSIAHHYPSSYNNKKGLHPCWITVWQGFHRAGVSERVFVTMLDKYFSAFVCRAAKVLQCLPPPTVLYTPDGVRIESFEDLQPNGHYLIFPSGSTYDEQHLPTLMLQILSTEA